MFRYECLNNTNTARDKITEQEIIIEQKIKNSEFQFKYIEETQLKEIIKGLPNRKATGLDCVNNEL